jgi:hypothetical protein
MTSKWEATTIDQLSLGLVRLNGYVKIRRRQIIGKATLSDPLVLALNSQIASRVPGPLLEGLWRVPTEPGNEELGDLVVVSRVGVRVISNKRIIR